MILNVLINLATRAFLSAFLQFRGWSDAHHSLFHPKCRNADGQLSEDASLDHRALQREMLSISENDFKRLSGSFAEAAT